MGTSPRPPAVGSRFTVHGSRFTAHGSRKALDRDGAQDYHGGAGEQCLTLLADGLEWARREERSLAEAAGWIVDRAVAGGTRLPGLGHCTHDEDPRAAVLFALARAHGLAGDGVTLIGALREEATRRIRPLPINVDGVLAAVLLDLGFAPVAARFVLLVGRVAGLTAQVAEELDRERPMRITVPVAYDGPAARMLPPDDPV